MADEMNKKMEQVIEEEGHILKTASGASMLPCIRPKRDILHLVKPEAYVKKYDVILYKRRNDTYILHRIWEVREEDYVLCGDNQYCLEYGVKRDQILGILKGFYRDEKYIDCEENECYRRYVRIWCSSLTVRKWLICLMRILRGLRGCFID